MGKPLRHRQRQGCRAATLGVIFLTGGGSRVWSQASTKPLPISRLETMKKKQSKIELPKLKGAARKNISSMLKELEGGAASANDAPRWPTRFIAVPASKSAPKRR